MFPGFSQVRFGGEIVCFQSLPGFECAMRAAAGDFGPVTGGRVCGFDEMCGLPACNASIGAGAMGERWISGLGALVCWSLRVVTGREGGIGRR